MGHTEKLLKARLEENAFNNCAVAVGDRSGLLKEWYLDDGQLPTTAQTRFDMASVTKILGVTLPLLRLLDRGISRLDQTIGDFFPDAPERIKEISLLRLWTHSAGISSWFSIEKEAVSATPEAISQCILSRPLIGPVGGQVVYSCPSFVLLGHILEKQCQKSLQKIFEEEVAQPLALKNTGYLPDRCAPIVPANPQLEQTGIVNDGMARFRGGISGNAGIFSCMADMEKVCTCLANRGKGLMTEETFEKALCNYTASLEEDRGLGFLLATKRYPQTGKLFPNGAFGHCGHTGTSFFVDRETGFYAIILTNATRCTGIPEQYDRVMQLRADIHNALAEDFL